MPIHRDNEFLVSDDMLGQPAIGLESNILRACADECRQRPFRAVFGSSHFGFAEDTLDVFLDLPHVEKVHFWDVALKNIDALSELPHLRYLNLPVTRPALDFARMPELREVVWLHKPEDRGMGSLCHLELLHSWRFQPKSKDFFELGLPARALELHILWANPATLSGLTPIPELRKLELSYCRNISDLSELPKLFPALEHLGIHACGRVEPAETLRILAGHPCLKFAVVNGRRIV